MGGSPECGPVSADDDDISFDPAQFDREGDSQTLTLLKPQPGGEDWLSVGFHVEHHNFDELAELLDSAQANAAAGSEGDVVDLGGVSFLVAERGARQGSGNKSQYMRWRMTTPHGLTVLLMNRGEPHATRPNATVRATSLPLMRFGFERTWQMMLGCIEALGATIVGDKLSRVDACVDLVEMPMAALAEPFDARWIVSRARKRNKYAEGRILNSYIAGENPCGFSVGKAPLMARAYDKLLEAKLDPQKLAILVAQRWGCLPSCATRVEFEIHRTKLKQFGVDTVDDWRRLRGDILHKLHTDWLRLTAGPVDRKHPDRMPTHPAWERVREAFAWAGETSGAKLTPLPKLWVDTSRQYATAVGILKGSFARAGKRIENNHQFFLEVEAAVREAVGVRDMAKEVARKAREFSAAVTSDF